MSGNVSDGLQVFLRTSGRPIDAGGTDFIAGGWGIDGWDTLVGGFDGI